MKIRMKVDLSGLLDGVAVPPRGEVFEVSDVAGAQYCAKGFAEPVVEERKVEKAVAAEPEKRGPGRPRKTEKE